MPQSPPFRSAGESVILIPLGVAAELFSVMNVQWSVVPEVFVISF